MIRADQLDVTRMTARIATKGKASRGAMICADANMRSDAMDGSQNATMPMMMPNLTATTGRGLGAADTMHHRTKTKVGTDTVDHEEMADPSHRGGIDHPAHPTIENAVTGNARVIDQSHGILRVRGARRSPAHHRRQTKIQTP